MKKSTLSFLMLLSFTFIITSCSKDKEETTATTIQSALKIAFDNVYGNQNLVLNTSQPTNSQAETLAVSDLKYIISNIVLTKSDGTKFTYPKGESYFIVMEKMAESMTLHLKNIPLGDYQSISFGIGVDEAQYNLGVTGMRNFNEYANAYHMLWTWSAGYRYLVFEGKFTSPSITTETNFEVHTGKSGSNYNYAEKTITFDSPLKLNGTTIPTLKIIADANKIIDGTSKIKLADYNSGALGAVITGGNILTTVTTNIQSIFSFGGIQ